MTKNKKISNNPPKNEADQKEVSKPKKKYNYTKKTGAPTKYTPELGQWICSVIASSTDGLEKLSKKHQDFPCKDTIYEWIYRFSDFSDLYARAKRTQADLFATEIAEIADAHYETREEVLQARLRIDTRKWIACKLIPKVYGDKIHSEATLIVKHEDALEELK